MTRPKFFGVLLAVVLVPVLCAGRCTHKPLLKLGGGIWALCGILHRSTWCCCLMER